ncbi:MAG: hypothetical protein IH626_16950 [Rhodospirillales bacterium]|nr:hypothetical protein [Rhodospirillales bacterium]
MAQLYRRKVADLTEALGSEDTRTEACELIRSLIEAIVLVPVDGTLKVDLQGDLAGHPPSLFGKQKALAVFAGGPIAIESGCGERI